MSFELSESEARLAATVVGTHDQVRLAMTVLDAAFMEQRYSAATEVVEKLIALLVGEIRVLESLHTRSLFHQALEGDG